jgi:hypothetical protein
MPTKTFHTYSAFGTSFRDKLERISLWSPVRSQYASPKTVLFESGISEALVQVGGICRRYSLSTASPTLHYELVRATQEDLGGAVPAQFAAEGALDRDGLKWEFLDARGNIAAAHFAGHDEGFCGLRGLGTWQIAAGFGQRTQGCQDAVKGRYDLGTGGGRVTLGISPKDLQKLTCLTLKYRCLGGIPCVVKWLEVKVRCRL